MTESYPASGIGAWRDTPIAWHRSTSISHVFLARYLGVCWRDCGQGLSTGIWSYWWMAWPIL